MDQSVWLWKWFIIFSHGISDARGALIAFREELNYRVITQHVDNNGRYIVLNVLIDNNPVILVNYYAPNVKSEQLNFSMNQTIFSIVLKSLKILCSYGVEIST